MLDIALCGKSGHFSALLYKMLKSMFVLEDSRK